MEDFIFDDDVDEVGAEVEAHCPKCKADTTHVIISKYEDEIRRVQCNPCGDVHSYRKPRGESDEEQPEAPTSKKKVKAKPTWEQVMAKAKKPPRPYALAEYFKEMEIVSHPKFGVGYVTENIGDDKIEVTFQDDKRVLVHNRKGLTLPFSMLRPLTPPAAKGKGGKSGKASAKPAEPVVGPPPKAKPEKPMAAAKAQKPQKGAARPAAKKPAKAAPPPPRRAAKAATAKAAAKKKPARAAAPVRAKAPAKKLKKSR
jgi:hypothetical protein